MEKIKDYSLLKFDHFILPLLLALAFYVVFIPHSSYPYPVHLDEWIHMGGSKQIAIEANAVGLMDPGSGEPYADGRDYEVGYHLFWAVFHQVSGIPWITIFRYFPGIIFMFTVISVYILARRHGFGWEAAFFTCLIPTTVGILGPAFMVPIAMGLLFIPLSLFLIYNYRTVGTYIVLFIFMAFLLTIHGPTGVVLVIVVVPFIILGVKGDFKHICAVTLTLAAPFLISLPWTWHLIAREGVAIFTQHDLLSFVDYPRLAKIYGYPIIGLCLVGTFVLAVKGSKKDYGLILGLFCILIILSVFYTTQYGIPILYYRGLIPMLLMAGIIAGAGLMAIREIGLSQGISTRLKLPPVVARNIGNVLCVVSIGLTLAVCIPLRQNIPYYHMIDSSDYQAFTWIAQNVDSGYDRAILDPWKATAFTAVTGKTTYTRIGEYPKPSDEAAYAFLEEGCTDTNFMRQNNISIVYTDRDCRNTDLIGVRQNIYLLPEFQETE